MLRLSLSAVIAQVVLKNSLIKHYTLVNDKQGLCPHAEYIRVAAAVLCRQSDDSSVQIIA